MSFEVFSVTPFTATFRTVRSERAARFLVRLYTRLGYVDRFGTRLSFDYAAAGEGWTSPSVAVSFRDGRPAIVGTLLSGSGTQVAVRTGDGATVGIAVSQISSVAVTS